MHLEIVSIRARNLMLYCGNALIIDAQDVVEGILNLIIGA